MHTLKSHSTKVDMTTGPILSRVLIFALPLIAGNILQQLYNTVDTVVVGRFCDSASLAAVGTSGQPVEILLHFFTGIGAAASILVAQYTGRGESHRIGSLLRSANTLLYCIALPLTIIGYFAGPLILRLMNVPADAFGYATDYLRIIFFGTVASLGFNLNSGILKGLGDSGSSLIFLLISCVTNIALDLVFVAGFENGVAGVALATVIAQFVSWLCSIIYILRKYPEFGYSPLPVWPQREYLREIVRLGLPLGFNSSIYSVGHLVVQALINTQGTAFIAGCSVATKLTGISHIAVSALSAAAATYAGQNFGAGNKERLRKGHLLLPLGSGALTLAVDMIFLVVSRPLIGIFTQDREVIRYAYFYLVWSLPYYCMYSVFNGIINFVHGVGEIRYPTFINILALWGIRIPVAWLICRFFNGEYVILSFPISFAFGMISMLLYYRTGRWKDIIHS